MKNEGLEPGLIRKFIGRKVSISDHGFEGEWIVAAFSDEKQQYFLRRLTPFGGQTNLNESTWVEKGKVEQALSSTFQNTP